MTRERSTAWRVFLVFLRLGLTSFGGPIAHLGYFHAEFVNRRRWLDEHEYADLVALCQFLPGPASSQVGLALGLRQAGWRGAFAAWAGFTLPSALVLIVFAYGVSGIPGLAASPVVHGLKLAAVAVVAQAVWGMARSLCPDRPRAALAIIAALLVLAVPSAPGQVAAIVLGGVAGARLRDAGSSPTAAQPGGYPITRRQGLAALVLFVGLLLALPLWAAAAGSPVAAMISGVYRAGALVFGGGHVVLPLLQDTVVPVGYVSNTDFLAGYGAAQAVPGPLFTFASYLGAVGQGPLHGWVGGLLFLGVIFLPAFLLVIAAVPWWDAVRKHTTVRRAMAGINASVVGILGAALYDPVWTSAIHSRLQFAVALAAFGLLVVARLSPLLVVALCAITGVLLL
ncbi:chromate efflux transporter [Pusillimonas sp. TS35]|uniref:chromate efflux transporter n=1 Tax=Paracandidimonas lactea TaxID=2895524 RepID=UPI00136EF46C|nr:chromate efflux transporter [Paracandidimonas lactea]MYN12283.1 chromate efflux transporter [Pusillimonas sp. TS35]